MPTVKEKIIRVLLDYREKDPKGRLTSEEIFLMIHASMDSKIRMTTLGRQLYDLVKDRMISIDGRNSYFITDEQFPKGSLFVDWEK